MFLQWRDKECEKQVNCLQSLQTLRFDAFWLIVHTTTIENVDENGSFPKTVAKVKSFENAPFLVCRVSENECFWKRWRKKRQILSFPSAFSSVLMWNRRKHIREYTISHSSALIPIGENKTKTLLLRFRIKLYSASG